MKNLVLGSLIAVAASQTAGCVITSGDPEPAHVAATWKMIDISTNTVTACPTGFATAALFNQAVDANDAPIGTCAREADNNESTCFVDLFDCSANAGLSFPLPATRFKTWIQIANDALTTSYATSVPAYVDITDVDQVYNAEILNDGGYFYLRWNLIGGTSNANLSCGQAGAAGGVEAIATVSGSTESNSDRWDCEDRQAYTAGYRAASYTISVAALNAADFAVGSAPELTNKVMGRQNAVVDLGLVNIPITGM